MISPLAVVETDQIGENVTIYEFAVVRKNVVLGTGVVVHPHVVIEEGVVVGAGTEVFPGTYLGKTPKGVGATARPIEFQRRLVIGESCALGPNAVVFYDVEIGSHTLVGDGASIREGCHVGSRCIIGRHVTLNYETWVGEAVKIMDHTWLAGNLRVGDGVFISGGVLTANDNNMGQQGYTEGEVMGPQIMDGALIGVGAILLPDVKIGEHAVVAAGSVVTKDVHPYDLVKGIPARVAKNLQQPEADQNEVR